VGPWHAHHAWACCHLAAQQEVVLLLLLLGCSLLGLLGLLLALQLPHGALTQRLSLRPHLRRQQG
jgi:hypothetical protein